MIYNIILFIDQSVFDRIRKLRPLFAYVSPSSSPIIYDVCFAMLYTLIILVALLILFMYL